MRDAYLVGKFDELNKSLTKAATWGTADPELGAILAGYFVVVLSGTVEDSVEYLVSKRGGRPGDKAIKAFIAAQIGITFRNPDRGKIEEILKRFDSAYCDVFKKKITFDCSSSLQSVVSNKNYLAHGTLLKLTVSLGDARTYYEGCKELIELLEDIFDLP